MYTHENFAGIATTLQQLFISRDKVMQELVQRHEHFNAQGCIKLKIFWMQIRHLKEEHWLWFCVWNREASNRENVRIEKHKTEKMQSDSRKHSD